jgi:hypothetical protein
LVLATYPTFYGHRTGPFGFSYDVSKTSLNFGVSMFPGILSGNESWSTSMTSFCFSWELESALLDRILDHITKNNPILSIMSPGLVPFALLFLFDLFFGVVRNGLAKPVNVSLRASQKLSARSFLKVYFLKSYFRLVWRVLIRLQPPQASP